MKCLKFLKNVNKKENGSVVVLVALLFTFVLLGISALVLDLGSMYNSTALLQNDLDSIAMAAVREVPNGIDAVKEKAKTYADLNHISDFDKEIDVAGVNISGKLVGVTVTGKTKVDYNFAKVFKIGQSTTIPRSATAELKVVNGMSGLLPIALPEGVLDIIKKDNLTLKYGANKDEGMTQEMIDIYNSLTNQSGWRGAINFLEDDDKTVAVGGSYKDAMKSGGFKGLVSTEDIEAVNAGTMNVESSLAAGQIAYVPVVVKVDGKTDLKVVGFATIKIESVTSKIITASYVSNYIVPGTATAGYAKNFGVYVAKLTN